MKLRHRSLDLSVQQAFAAALPDPRLTDPRLAEVKQEHADHARRHAALLDSIATTIPAALLLARTQAWDAGWEAARHGLPKTANPLHPGD
jgi:hypothetical protein